MRPVPTPSDATGGPTVEVYSVDADGSVDRFLSYATLIASGVIAPHPPLRRPPLRAPLTPRAGGRLRVVITEPPRTGALDDGVFEVIGATYCTGRSGPSGEPLLAKLDRGSRSTPAPLPFPAAAGDESSEEALDLFVGRLGELVASEARSAPRRPPRRALPVDLVGGVERLVDLPLTPPGRKMSAASAKTKPPWCFICHGAIGC